MSHTALQARYGDEAPALNLPDLAVLDAMLNHRSVRHFLRDPLPANTVETLVAAAQSAPTSSNLQTWSVIAVESQGRREALANLVGPQRHLAVAPLVLVWLADLSRIERLGKAQGRHPVGLNYLDTLLMGVIDAALAAQNAVVAAEAMGLGTVYVGGMRNQPEEVAKVCWVRPAMYSPCLVWLSVSQTPRVRRRSSPACLKAPCCTVSSTSCLWIRRPRLATTTVICAPLCVRRV